MKHNLAHALDIQFSYFLRCTHQYKNGEYPIVLRTSYRRERRDVFTGLTCKKQDWLPLVGRVDLKAKSANSINKLLNDILYRAKEEFGHFKYSGEVFTIDKLIEGIKGIEAPPQTVLEFCQLKLNELEDEVGVNITKTTFFKYKRAVRYLKDFLLHKKSMKNIAINNIDEVFLNALFLYIRKEKNNVHNSTMALMICLKCILGKAIKLGVLKQNPFENFQINYKPVQRDFLNMDEIRLLQNVEGLTDAEERNRDLFLFACYTGLAYADIKNLSSRHIHIDPDGTKNIIDQREKTGVTCIIPLLNVAETILIKYSPTGDCKDFYWKIPCNQKLNFSLKAIAKKAGVEKNIFMHLGRHTFATTITLNNGVSLESVSKMLGHTTMKHTQIYAKITASRVKNDMEKIRNIFN